MKRVGRGVVGREREKARSFYRLASHSHGPHLNPGVRF